MCSYNPTSIIWRYAAITDRRIRAIQWSRRDLAATNAIFWTSDGWNGGEEMVTSSATYCLRYPESTRVEILSLTMLKTVITTLQGASAFYILVGSVAGVFCDCVLPLGLRTTLFTREADCEIPHSRSQQGLFVRVLWPNTMTSNSIIPRERWTR